MRTRNPGAGKLVIASHNAGKVREINNMLEPFGIKALSAAGLGLAVPAETGSTFEENAAIKAHAAAIATGFTALGDDSGLCVDALDGAPGIHTADWAEKPDGTGRNFDFAIQRIEQALRDSKTKVRGARFVAVLCLAWPDGHQQHFRGEVEGKLIWPPRGDRGFGYDPVFLPNGYSTTFGEMSAREKHGWDPQNPDSALSHRARAFVKLAQACLDRV